MTSMMLPDSIATAKASLSGLVYDQSFVNDEAARDRFAARLSANDGVTVRSILGSLPSSTEWLNRKLQSITIPALIVWGSEDRLVPLAHGREFAAGMPNARLVEIEKCGHAPLVERPADFLAAIRDFLHVRQQPR